MFSTSSLTTIDNKSFAWGKYVPLAEPGLVVELKKKGYQAEVAEVVSSEHAVVQEILIALKTYDASLRIVSSTEGAHEMIYFYVDPDNGKARIGLRIGADTVKDPNQTLHSLRHEYRHFQDWAVFLKENLRKGHTELDARNHAFEQVRGRSAQEKIVSEKRAVLAEIHSRLAEAREKFKGEKVGIHPHGYHYFYVITAPERQGLSWIEHYEPENFLSQAKPILDSLAKKQTYRIRHLVREGQQQQIQSIADLQKLLWAEIEPDLKLRLTDENVDRLKEPYFDSVKEFAEILSGNFIIDL